MRVLFVDDDPMVLESLERMLFGLAGQWNLSFVLGAQAALKELVACSYDVIVTDMRMPGDDGASLLREVKELHPSVVRIILSGYAEEEAVLRSIPVAHQFLNKPCTGKQLEEVVHRTCALREMLTDKRIRQILGDLGTLPSRPATFSEMTRTLADPKHTLDDLADVVNKDIAMSAKVLQLVNSSFIGLPQRVTKIRDAVRYIGAEMLKNLVLSLEVFKALECDIPGFSLDAEHHHAF